MKFGSARKFTFSLVKVFESFGRQQQFKRLLQLSIRDCFLVLRLSQYISYTLGYIPYVRDLFSKIGTININFFVEIIENNLNQG